MTKDVAEFRKEFFLEQPTHVPLNNAGLSMLSKVAVLKLEKLSLMHAQNGAFGFPMLIKEYEESKQTMATLLGAKPRDFAWTPNCSAGLSYVAGGLEKTSSEEIVILENDYPANFYPWVARAKRDGSQLRVIEAEKDLSRSIDKVKAAITEKTKIIAFSHIQSDCGYLMDISEVSKAAHAVGAVVVVDVIQSVGNMPINFESCGADIICGGSHKWLCGPMGAGFIVLKEEVAKKIKPILHGALNYGTFEDAPSVDKQAKEGSLKFEQGTAALHTILGTAASAKMLLEYSVDKLWKKSLELRMLLKNGMIELGFQVYGGELTGPQISVSHLRKNIKELSLALEEKKISHALRPAPLAEGRVLRLSPFAYNTHEEIQFTLETLRKALA